jgi:hypothetical protein
MRGGFIPTTGGDLISVDQISVIGRVYSPDGKALPRRQVILRSGDEYYVPAHEFEAWQEQPVQLMPAEPGTTLLDIQVENLDAPEIYRTPLIAWAICRDGSIRVVTPSGVDDDGSTPRHGFYVEMPDGRVCAAGSGMAIVNFDSAQEMLDHFVRDARARIARGANTREDLQ